MVLFVCEKCGSAYGSEVLAKRCENKPVTHNTLKPGFVFKVDYPQDQAYVEYGVITAPAKALPEHVQQYNIMGINGAWLNDGYNPHWVRRWVISGNSPLIAGIADKEFSKIRDGLERWVGKELEFMAPLRKMPNQLELTNKLE
jgi:hypothetical protein